MIAAEAALDPAGAPEASGWFGPIEKSRANGTYSDSGFGIGDQIASPLRPPYSVALIYFASGTEYEKSYVGGRD